MLCDLLVHFVLFSTLATAAVLRPIGTKLPSPTPTSHPVIVPKTSKHSSITQHRLDTREVDATLVYNQYPDSDAANTETNWAELLPQLLAGNRDSTEVTVVESDIPVVESGSPVVESDSPVINYYIPRKRRTKTYSGIPPPSRRLLSPQERALEREFALWLYWGQDPDPRFADGIPRGLRPRPKNSDGHEADLVGTDIALRDLIRLSRRRSWLYSGNDPRFPDGVPRGLRKTKPAIISPQAGYPPVYSDDRVLPLFPNGSKDSKQKDPPADFVLTRTLTAHPLHSHGGWAKFLDLDKFTEIEQWRHHVGDDDEEMTTSDGKKGDGSSVISLAIEGFKDILRGDKRKKGKKKVDSEQEYLLSKIPKSFPSKRDESEAAKYLSKRDDSGTAGHLSKRDDNKVGKEAVKSQLFFWRRWRKGPYRYSRDVDREALKARLKLELLPVPWGVYGSKNPKKKPRTVQETAPASGNVYPQAAENERYYE